MTTLLPTVDGYAQGIVAVGRDPETFTLQCSECGRFHVAKGGTGLGLILSGSRFHLCEDEPLRYCPSCYYAALRACSRRRHSESTYDYVETSVWTNTIEGAPTP